MKNLYQIIVISLLSLSFANINHLYAQENSKPNTLFGNDTKVGYFFAPMVQYAAADQGDYVLAGAKVGLQLSKKWSTGFQYLTTVNETNIIVENNSWDHDQQLLGWFVEYTLFSDRLVHLTIPVVLGGAESNIDDYGSSSNNNFEDDYLEKRFFFVEPGVNVEVNLDKRVRLFGGVTYRWVNELGENEIDTYRLRNRLHAITAQAGIKVGLFR